MITFFGVLVCLLGGGVLFWASAQTVAYLLWLVGDTDGRKRRRAMRQEVARLEPLVMPRLGDLRHD